MVYVLLHLHRMNGESDMTIHKISKSKDNACHIAAFWGNMTITKMLIEAGIDFNCKNSDDKTPIDIGF